MLQLFAPAVNFIPGVLATVDSWAMEIVRTALNQNLLSDYPMFK